MYDALTNPPVPEWNSLSNDERERRARGNPPGRGNARLPVLPGAAYYIYQEIRKVLKARERRVLSYSIQTTPRS